jgi:hypothetical protein
MDVETVMHYFDKPPKYRSFLITMWQERSKDQYILVEWRFRLEDPHTGQRRGFADLESLIAALQQEMDDCAGEVPDAT